MALITGCGFVDDSGGLPKPLGHAILGRDESRDGRLESGGPIPGDHSMICFGAVTVEPSLSRTFHGQFRRITDCWIPEAQRSARFPPSKTLALIQLEPGIAPDRRVAERILRWPRYVSGPSEVFRTDDSVGVHNEG